MERLIFHIDVNNAFLSWEAIERLKEDPDSTDLRTIPSAICGDPKKRHGIILAKSPIAKQYGVVTAETIGNAQKKCPQLELFPSRYWVYEKYSSLFHNILKEYTDCVEPFSVDEAFLDMTGTCHLFGDPLSTAKKIQARIKDTYGFTVNIGISQNKILAKTASDFKGPNQVHTLFPEELEKKFRPLPIEKLLFSGRSSCEKLKMLGIHTIGDLAHSDPYYIQSHLGKNGILLHNYANGIDPSPVLPERPEPKGYSNSITTDHDITTLQEANKILLSLCETIGYRLRMDESRTNVLSVQLKDCFFRKQSKQCVLSEPCNNTKLLYQQACILFQQLWDGSTPIRLLGIHATKLESTAYTQLSLFDCRQNRQQEQLEQAIDSIRNKFGSGAIMRASFLKPNEEKDNTNPGPDS